VIADVHKKGRVMISLLSLAMCCTLHATQVVATNEHIATSVNMKGVGVSHAHADLVERITRMEVNCDSLRTTVDGLIRTIKSRDERDAAKEGKIECRLDKACACAEEFYEKRYGELKAANDRFTDRISIVLSIISITVALVGVLGAIFGIVVPLVKEHSRQTEWMSLKDGLKNDVAKLKSDAFRAIEKDRRLKAEFYFQMAKLGFENYKATKCVDILEIVVKNLSQCIMHNVGTMNSTGAKCAIVFLNSVLIRKPEGVASVEIIEHRKEVCARLKTWEWGFGIEELELLFSNSDIDESYVRSCLGTMKLVFSLMSKDHLC